MPSYKLKLTLTKMQALLLMARNCSQELIFFEDAIKRGDVTQINVSVYMANKIMAGLEKKLDLKVKQLGRHQAASAKSKAGKAPAKEATLPLSSAQLLALTVYLEKIMIDVPGTAGIARILATSINSALEIH